MPKWLQTLFGNGDSPNGIFFSAYPFPNGDPHMEAGIPVWETFPYGDFLVNPRMGTISLWKWVSD
jgi:hypothetical protein